MSILTGIFGSRNERLLKQYGRSVTKISALEDQIQVLDDDQLAAKTDEFRRQLEDGVGLDDIDTIVKPVAEAGVGVDTPEDLARIRRLLTAAD